jgi:hypothetical protein
LSEKFQLEIECCCVETGQEFCGKVSYSNGELIQTDYYKDTLCLAGVFYLFGLDGLADHYILCTYAPPRLNDTYISLEKSIKEWNSRYHDIPLVCPTNAQIAAFICVREVEAYRYDGKEIQKLSLMTSR